MHYYDHDFIYNYGLGYRLDTQPKCNPGNKPCGKTCIPNKSKCKVNNSEPGTRKRINPMIPGTIAAIGTLGIAGMAIPARKQIEKSKKRTLDELEVAAHKAAVWEHIAHRENPEFVEDKTPYVPPKPKVVDMNDWRNKKK